MILLPPDIFAALRRNGRAARAASREDQPAPDPVPVLKLFNPIGLAMWIATEIGEDGDTLFGLADLGFGCPELGYFSLGEIADVRLPFGLRIERDLLFSGEQPLSVWADLARRYGSILQAEFDLRRAALTKLPPPARK